MAAEKSNFSIVRMARLLNISRSGYYAWRGRKPSDRALRREAIEQKITGFHDDSDEVYGAPRILADLREDGEIISRKTVATSMRRLGLVGISSRKRAREPGPETWLRVITELPKANLGTARHVCTVYVIGSIPVRP